MQSIVETPQKQGRVEGCKYCWEIIGREELLHDLRLLCEGVYAPPLSDSCQSDGHQAFGDIPAVCGRPTD